MSLFRSIAAALEGALHAARETISSREIERIRRKYRFDNALRFNRENTFTASRPSRWMCPSCNRVSLSCGTVPHQGPQFWGCCEFGMGGRLGRHHATGICW